MNRQQFDELFASVSNWGRWGKDDQRGTLNLITPERVSAATALVRRGRSVSLSYLLSKVAGIDNPKPMLHYMSRLTLGMPGEPTMNEDFIGLDYHGKLVTHVARVVARPSRRPPLQQRGGAGGSDWIRRNVWRGDEHGGRDRRTWSLAGHAASPRRRVARAPARGSSRRSSRPRRRLRGL